MNVERLISILEEIKNAHGNMEVKCLHACWDKNGILTGVNVKNVDSLTVKSDMIVINSEDDNNFTKNIK